ncbi:MAG: peptide ABC transporter substrate-binding protein [Thermacetogeniaceae bacterium]
MMRAIRQRKNLVRWMFFAAIIGVVFFVFVISLLRGWRASSLSVQILRQPFTLDPSRMCTYEEKLIDGALYQSLMRYDPEKHLLEGELAEKWSVDKSGRTYTFVLRRGSRFSDGTPVTAWDVKYSWERVLDPKISSYGYLLRNVVGADERLSGSCQEVKGIQVVDDKTVRVTLEETDWTFPVVVSSPVLAVVKRDVAERIGTRYGKRGTRIVGSGPFRLVRWNKEMILLKRNRFFVSPGPSLSFLRFYAVSDQQKIRGLFERGKLDVLAGVPAQFLLSRTEDARIGFKIVRRPVLSIYFLGFNLRKEPIRSNVELRRGIAQAIDKQQMKELLLGEGGKILTGLLPLELLSENQDVGNYQFSKEVALKTLSKAGFPYGLGLQPLVFAYNDSPGNEIVARLIQEQLDQVGIDVNLRRIPWSRYQSEIRSGDVHFFRLGWEADYPEAGNLLYNIFPRYPDDRNNYTGYYNKDFDQLLLDARLEPDPHRRDEIYRMAAQILSSEMPVIPLFQKVATFYLSDRVKCFGVDLLGRVDFSRITTK